MGLGLTKPNFKPSGVEMPPRTTDKPVLPAPELTKVVDTVLKPEKKEK